MYQKFIKNLIKFTYPVFPLSTKKEINFKMRKN